MIPHLKCLAVAFQMRDHNMGFYADLTENIPTVKILNIGTCMSEQTV